MRALRWTCFPGAGLGEGLASAPRNRLPSPGEQRGRGASLGPRTSILGGSWDLVSRVISTLIGVVSNCNYSYLTCNPSY